MESSKVIVVQVVAMTNNTALHRFRIFVVCFIDPDILIDVISDDGMECGNWFFACGSLAFWKEGVKRMPWSWARVFLYTLGRG